MKADWEIKKLGEVCKIVNGGTPDTNIAEFWDGKNLWITPKDMGRLDGIFVDNTFRKLTDSGLKNSSAKVLPIDSIILSSRAPIGHLAINRKPISTNQGCKGLVPNKNLSSLYLYYFLDKSVELLNSLGTGATFKELSSAKLADVQIPLPPLTEQQRIVVILDETFAAIDRAKANAETNRQNARALFESYLQSVFANPGEGWEEKLLSSICDVKDGTHDSPRYVETGVPFVTQKNIREDGLTLSNTKFISIEDHQNFYRRSNAAYGDILLSMIGANRGMACLVDHNSVFSIKNVALIKGNNKVNQSYLLYFLKSPKAKKYVLDNSNGGAQEFIGLSQLRKFPIVYVSLPIQQTIVAKLDALSAETKKLEAIYRQKIADLDELKKAILQKAFRGELSKTQGEALCE